MPCLFFSWPQKSFQWGFAPCGPLPAHVSTGSLLFVHGLFIHPAFGLPQGLPLPQGWWCLSPLLTCVLRNFPLHPPGVGAAAITFCLARCTRGHSCFSGNHSVPNSCANVLSLPIPQGSSPLVSKLFSLSHRSVSHIGVC